MPQKKLTAKEYLEAKKETEELLSNPEWAEMIRRGKEEVKRDEGKSLDELGIEVKSAAEKQYLKLGFPARRCCRRPRLSA